MKKTNIFIISTLMMVGISSLSLAYTDVSGHWAEETINKMNEYKIVNGYSDDSFRPDNEMTRAEFVTVVNRLLGIKKESNKYIPDISRQDWYYSEVRRAVEAGIIQGDELGYIHPDKKITREEAVVMLARAFKIRVTTNIQSKYIDQDDISSWAKENFLSFVNQGYITGYNDETLKPKNTIKRAEAITIINRIIPNILTANIYEGTISGNTLVYGDNVTLNNVTINGNLIISNGSSVTLTTRNVIVNGNLIIFDEKIDELSGVKVKEKIIDPYQSAETEIQNYINNKYGIKFSIPSAANVKELNDEEQINYKEKDLVIIDIKQNDEYYLKSIKTIAREESKKYANLFKAVETGKIGLADYMVYDDKENAQMLVVKRDSVVYTLIFLNIVSENFLDNVLSTMELLPIDNVIDSKEVIYKNSKLSLKFTYKDIYVSVDDSYNTNNINNENSLFKLFIQVNTITDIQNYNFNEIKALLTSLVKNDGKILKTESLKIVNNDALKFKIQSEEKLIYSLYVIIGNNLYNFIFTGDEVGMNEVGENLFNEIIETLEF